MSIFQSFKKAQVASLIATGLDYLLFMIMFEFSGFWPVFSVCFSSSIGGIIHFKLSRTWVFKTREKSIPQLAKYIPVAIGSVLLNSLGFYLLNGLVFVSALISKIVASLAIGWGFNFTMHRYFVFRR